MKYLIAALLFLNTAMAQERTGNGGTGAEVKLASQEAILTQTVGKIRNFFANNPKLAETFPEFTVLELLAATDSLEIQVAQEDVLDYSKKIRTCINFDKTIRCTDTKLDAVIYDPNTLFVLMFHEILGLMGVEETSPDDVRVIDGYSISKRLIFYLVKTSSYDLEYKEVDTTPAKKCSIKVTYSEKGCAFSSYSPYQRELKFRKMLRSKGYKIVNDGKNVEYSASYTGAYLACICQFGSRSSGPGMIYPVILESTFSLWKEKTKVAELHGKEGKASLAIMPEADWAYRRLYRRSERKMEDLIPECK